MKASPWEIEDAQREDIPIFNCHVPKEFIIKDGKLAGVRFELVKAEYNEGGRRKLIPTGEPDVIIEATDVLIAIGQLNHFPWIERDIGMEFNEWEMPIVDAITYGTSIPNVFIGGDAAFGPENIITAVAHGHQAAISIDKFCNGESVSERLPPMVTLANQKMGIHEWIYDNDVIEDLRYPVPHADKSITLKDRKVEVELGFDQKIGFKEAQRCLNCDIQTVFNENLCIECDACVDICPTTCITFTENGDEDDLRTRLNAPAEDKSQDLYVSDKLPTKRVMIKDEDVCLHCGLCAERCPTAAWDMEKYMYQVTKATKIW